MFSLRCRGRLPHQFRNCIFKVLHGKLGGANKGLGEATKTTRGRSMEARPTQSRKGVKGGLRPFSSAPCRVKGQRPLWGLGQRPNCSAGDQHLKRTQQRCRQRSVPASNFARPQTRPKAALPPRFREEPFLRRHRTAGRRLNPTASCSFCVSRRFFYSTFLFFVGMC